MVTCAANVAMVWWPVRSRHPTGSSRGHHRLEDVLGHLLDGVAETSASGGAAELASGLRLFSPYLICPEPDEGGEDNARLPASRHLGLRQADLGRSGRHMPHNMVFGLSNYVSLAIVIVIVIVVVGVWWLRARPK